MTRWPMSVLWATAVLFLGCSTDPVHVDRAHIKQSATPARRVQAKKLACAIQWQGLHDVREIKDPIGYIGLKAVQFPELRDELDQRMRDTIARTGSESQPISMIVEVDLLRSYVEHHATLIVFNTWFRIKTETQSTNPPVLNTASRKTLMTGSDSEIRQFLRTSMQDSADQLLARLNDLCPRH